jgi:hypothetical protein
MSIITLNCLLVPYKVADRSKLSEGSITTLKISTGETVDQLRIMIRERWPHLFKRFLLPAFYSGRSMIPRELHHLKNKLKYILVGNV